MPEVRPGQVFYAVATKAVAHGAPCTELGFAGIAIKQTAAVAGVGLGDPTITTVQVGESFIIQIKGRVYVSNANAAGGTFSKGDPVYIIAASNALTSASAGNGKFGRVADVAPARGVGTGRVTVDLDAKDSF